MTLVLDAGSSLFKAGYSTPITFQPNVTKSKGKPDVIGPPGVRFRTPFESGVIVNSDVMETLLDYTFHELGTPERVFTTEPLCNPALSRGLVAELLFETYNIESASWAVDSLCSMNLFNPTYTGKVCSINSQTTTVIDCVDGIPNYAGCTRIPVGVNSLVLFMQSLLQLKYPYFPHYLDFEEFSRFTKNCYIAVDYAKEATNLINSDDIVMSYVAPKHQQVLERVKLTMEEQHRLNTDKSNWIMELVRESQVQKPIKVDRRKSETQKKMKKIAKIMDNDKLIDDDENLDFFDKETRDDAVEDAILARTCRVEKLLAEFDPYRYHHRRCFPLISRLTDGLDDEFEAENASQIRLNLERIRVPEALFWPHLVGSNKKGISQVLAGASSVYCTGGGSNFPYLKERLINDLRPFCPVDLEFEVTIANDPTMDAFNGALKFAKNLRSWTTKQEYLENGPIFFCKHALANKK